MVGGFMRSFFAILLLGLVFPALAQQVEIKDDNEPPVKTGQEKAKQYFGERKRSDARFRTGSEAPAPEGTPRFMAVHIGSFFADQAYKWGKGDMDNIGKLNAGVDYRIGEWVNSMDLGFRLDFTSYGLDEGNARKLSVGTILTFPDANSRFPLYFGGGLGLGFFLKQIGNESALALDYSVFGGVRFLDVIERLGFMVEAGLKNHFLLLSDGQFNGAYINVGTVFAF
jgi:hypothetical protein